MLSTLSSFSTVINTLFYFLNFQMFVAHHPETPRIRQDGIDIHPGTSTRLALSPVQVRFKATKNVRVNFMQK